MKHIDVVTKYFYPVAAGIETNILETYSKLDKSEWDVTIHTSKDEYLKKNSLADTEVIKDITVRRYPFHTDYFGFYPDINWDTTDVVCLHNFNVFYWRFFLHSLWLKVIGRKHFALILTPHGGYTPEWSIFGKLTATLKQLYHFQIGKILINLSVDRVRAVSQWEKAEIVQKGITPDKVVTISNGVEDEAYQDIEALASADIKTRVSQLGRYLIQVGRIYKIKNYETVIRALPHIPSEINFVIIGQPEKDRDYQDGLLQLARELGVENRVKFIGVVRGVDKYYVIKHAQMMVHMAIWESFCNVVHEGLSQGLICLVANAYALPYLIKDRVNGYLIDTFDSVTLAERINFVLENYDSPNLQAMRERNQVYGRQDSWKNVAAKMSALYRSQLQ